MIWRLTINKEWSSLVKEFNWVSDMKGVPQDSIYHAEGDVAIHTSMVLDALKACNEYGCLSEQDQEIIWTSALFHDVEKRSTTVIEDDGRITSAGPARKGELTSRQIMFHDLATPFALRESIAALVRYHGLPLWAMEKRDPAKAVIEASLRTNMPMLALLAKADVLGRTCSDKHSLLERIEMFQALCEEQECWNSPRTFTSGLARFVYFRKENSSADYVPFDDLKGEVIMMCGLPGMGKDTFLKKNFPDLSVISLDDIRRRHKLRPDDSSATGWAVQAAKESAKTFLRKGTPFAWNATNITRQMRTQWIDLFVSYKARVRLIYIETPYERWLRQNREREHPVPHDVLMRLLQKLEVPSLYEAHEVRYYAD
jgi:predicted kinase